MPKHWLNRKYPNDVGEPQVVRTFQANRKQRTVQSFKSVTDFIPCIKESEARESIILSKWEVWFQKKGETYTITRHHRKTDCEDYYYLKLWKIVPVEFFSEYEANEEDNFSLGQDDMGGDESGEEAIDEVGNPL